MHISAADYLIIAGFFVVMLLVGFYFSRRMRDLQDYFSGGRQVPWWLSGISLYMSAFSAFTFVAYSEVAYKYGWVAITANWTAVPAMLISAYYFGPLWRRAARTSPLEFIEKRYGGALRQCLAWLGIPMTIIDDGLKLLAIGTLVSVGLNLEEVPVFGMTVQGLEFSIVASGLIMLAYTFMGGLWAVLVTDFVQFIVMVAAVLALFPLALFRVGGIDGFIEQVPEGFFRLSQSSDTPGAIYTWVYLVAFLVVMTLSYSSRWSFVQRYYSVRTDKDVYKIGWLVAILSLVGPAVLLFPAMAGRIFLPEVENTLDVYMLVCKDLLPVGMIGMMIAAMFSATMSMLSSDYNAVAAVLTNDVIRPLTKTQASEKNLVWIGRFSTLVVGLVAVVLGLYLAEVKEQDLFQMMARLFAIFLPPIALPMLLGLVTGTVSHAGGLLGFLMGITAGFAAFKIETLAGVDLQWMPVITCITVSFSAAGILIGTFLSENNPEDEERIALFLEGIRGEETVQASPGTANVSPAPVIGVSVGALGLLVVAVVLPGHSFSEAWVSLVIGLGLAVTGLLLWVFGRPAKDKGA
jgi:SSS family transporter